MSAMLTQLYEADASKARNKLDATSGEDIGERAGAKIDEIVRPPLLPFVPRPLLSSSSYQVCVLMAG
jgi:hypothetical protein